MPKKKKSPRRAPSPCPDPEKYILVKTKYRSYWRKKRGTVKPAVLNKVLTESASLTGPANKAANQLLTMLRLFTQRMILGRTMAKVAGAFKKTHLKTGNMNFSLLEGMD